MGVVANVGRKPGQILGAENDILFLDGTVCNASAPLGIITVNGPWAPQISLGKDDGSAAAANDTLGGLFFRGARNTTGGMSLASGIRGVAEANWNDGGLPGGMKGQLHFLTSDQEPVGFFYGALVRSILDSQGTWWMGANTTDALFSVDQTGSLTVGTTALPKLTIDGGTGDLDTKGGLKVAGITINSGPVSPLFQAIASVNGRIANPVTTLVPITVTTANNWVLTTNTPTITASPVTPVNGQLLTILMYPTAYGSVTFTEGGSSGLKLKNGTVTLSAGDVLHLVYSSVGAMWCEVGGGGGGSSTTGTDLTLSGFLQVDTDANVTQDLTVGTIGAPKFTVLGASGNVTILGTTTVSNPISGVVGANLELRGQAGAVGSTGMIKATSQLLIGESTLPGQTMSKHYNVSTVGGITEAIQRSYTQYRYNMTVPGGANIWNVATGTTAAGTVQALEVVVVGTNTTTNTQGWMYKAVAVFSSAGQIGTTTYTTYVESNAACGITLTAAGATWNVTATGTGGVTPISWHVYVTAMILDT